jgi:hypothetical protein
LGRREDSANVALPDVKQVDVFSQLFRPHLFLVLTLTEIDSFFRRAYLNATSWCWHCVGVQFKEI